MGAEISVQKMRNHYIEDTFRHSIMNNLSPIAFHEVHGDNIRLSNGGAIACRAEGFCKGITFSNRPVKVNEHILVKFTDISTSWSGALRIGFTANNPASFRSSLPRYACPDLTNRPGNWAKALAERFAKEGSILFYYVDESGDVHYGIDNEDIGVFFSGVNTSSQLWALLDVYGNTRTVELLAPHSLRSEDPNAVVNMENIVGSSRSPIQLVKKSDFPSNAFSGINLKSLLFHRTHSRNIIFNKNRNTAARKHGIHGLAYLFTARPVDLEEKVILEILGTETSSEVNLIFGVTSCDPASINDQDMPENCDDLLDRSEYWVIWRDRSCSNTGDIIICNITTEGEFQISRNCEPLSTVFFVDHTLPLWVFLDLCGTTREIHLIGSTNVLPDMKHEHMELTSKTLTVSLPPSKPLAAVALEHGNSLMENDNDCVICCENPVDCVLYRCGHMCLCYKCAKELFKPGSQCPVCRKNIADVIKTFR